MKLKRSSANCLTLAALVAAVCIPVVPVYLARSGPGANERAPELTVVALGSSGSEIAAAIKPGIRSYLILLSQHCPACELQRAILETVWGKTDLDHRQALALGLKPILVGHPDGETEPVIPIYWDSEDLVAGRFRPRSIPTGYVIDERGLILDRHEGVVSEDMVELVFSWLLDTANGWSPETLEQGLLVDARQVQTERQMETADWPPE